VNTAKKSITAFQKNFMSLHNQLSSVIVGQDEVISHLLIALLSGGHILLDGLPGLGKTQLIKALAASINVSLSRIQCTSDLMPADIIGSEILLKMNSSDNLHFNFQKGPVFNNLVLVDEINRAAPKTQSALLESMQEHQVTCAGTSYPLPHPFWVIATQNPIELEGTYPLPEAQLDRFMFKIGIQYPSASSLLNLLEITLDNKTVDDLKTVLDRQQIIEMMDLAKQVIISDNVKNAAVCLILATHGNHQASSSFAKQHIRYGASPRGLQALIKSAQIKALTNARAYVAIEDLIEVTLLSLRHRILLTLESELSGISPDDVLLEIIRLWKKSETNKYFQT